VEIKKLSPISREQIANAFQRDDLIIFTEPLAFKEFLFQQDFNNSTLLLMSSGNYGGLDFEEVKGLV
jgi:UDP-N-acetylmuramate: L-alanyl-gamma-D-glutamyl-meso-diaminopimelate ligase